MGVVYRAFDTKLNRPVAVKFLSEEIADLGARRRFQQEAQMASSLNHPNIVTVHDAGDWQGQQYVVTEFVDGGTLRDWAAERPRSWRQCVELLTGVAEGLAAAHEARILHRDIKPANILVSRGGYAKLADFGLARLEDSPASDDQTRTRTGMILGTTAYMSPEQARGEKCDSRSDIFSLGVVFYEMLSGKRPFEGRSSPETLQKIIHEQPASLSDSIPSALRDFVEKALEKEPSERYQSVRDMVVDLRRIARRTESRVASNLDIAPKRRSRMSLWIPAAAVLTIATLVAVFAFRPASWLRQPPSERPRIAVLPFVDLNHEENNQLLVDGLHEEILTSLTDRAGDRLQVIPRTTMALYRDSKKTSSEIAAELHATHVLEGSVRRDGEEIRLTLRLIDARTDRPIWDQAYTRSTQGRALILQAEVAGDVARQLPAALGGEVRVASRLSTDPIAAETLVRATLTTLTGAHAEKRWRDVEAEYTRAIERDPGFVRAYLARSTLRSDFFANGYDPSEHQLELAREDLREAERLAPHDPLVLAAKTQLAVLEENPDAARYLTETEAAGLIGPELVLLRAQVADNAEELANANSQLFELDPGGFGVPLWGSAATIRRPVDSLRAVDALSALQPGLWDALRAQLLFDFTGDLAPLAPFTRADRFLSQPSDYDPDDVFRILFERLILRREYAPARDLVDTFGRESIRVELLHYFVQPGIGRQPTADFRGWADLLLGDRDAAREDGRKVLAFVQSTPKTRWNGWFLEALRADALLFMGQNDEAVATSTRVLAEARSGRRSRQIGAAILAARVLAWAGRDDEAVSLLKELATGIPGLPPADIARQPYYTEPLRANAMFGELRARLETEMAATKLK
jgi:serine/threonine protein kinase